MRKGEIARCTSRVISAYYRKSAAGGSWHKPRLGDSRFHPERSLRLPGIPVLSNVKTPSSQLGIVPLAKRRGYARCSVPFAKWMS